MNRARWIGALCIATAAAIGVQQTQGGDDGPSYKADSPQAKYAFPKVRSPDADHKQHLVKAMANAKEDKSFDVDYAASNGQRVHVIVLCDHGTIHVGSASIACRGGLEELVVTSTVKGTVSVDEAQRFVWGIGLYADDK